MKKKIEPFIDEMAVFHFQWEYFCIFLKYQEINNWISTLFISSLIVIQPEKLKDFLNKYVVGSDTCDILDFPPNESVMHDDILPCISHPSTNDLLRRIISDGLGLSSAIVRELISDFVYWSIQTKFCRVTQPEKLSRLYNWRFLS